MARPLRVEYPGAFYHVLNRGIERRTLFNDDKDYENFLKLCRILHPKFKFILHSYCLMPNHYHLYIETPDANLSRLMQNLNSRYTQLFNRRYKRIGPLFQGRYKAILVDKENYSLQISRYIHLNPVKAKIVSKPEDYKWSSYRSFLGREKQEAFLETEWLLSQLANTIDRAKEDFHRFTMEGIHDTWNPFGRARGGTFLGEETFIDWAKEKFIAKAKDRSISRLREIQKPQDIGMTFPNPVDSLLRQDRLSFVFKGTQISER